MLKVSWKHKIAGAFLSLPVLVSLLHPQPVFCTDRVLKENVLEECLRADHRCVRAPMWRLHQCIPVRVNV